MKGLLRCQHLIEMKTFIGILFLVIATASQAYDDWQLLKDMNECGSKVHLDTLKQVIKVESRFHPFAVADAGPVNLPWNIRKSMVKSYYLNSKEEAISKVTELLNQGHTVSLGLMMLNDRNLKWMGISIADTFDPCTNIKYGSDLLYQNYITALKVFPDKNEALQAALSMYNSGDFYRGKRDGYVNLVYGIKPKKTEREPISLVKYDYNYYRSKVREFSLNGFANEH